jgi:hypothetical protein
VWLHQHVKKNFFIVLIIFYTSKALSTLTPSPGPQLSPSNYVESCSNCIEPFRLEDFLPSPSRPQSTFQTCFFLIEATSMPAQEGEGEAAPTMPVQEGEEEAAPHMPVHEGGEEAAPSKPAQEGEEEEGI